MDDDALVADAHAAAWRFFAPAGRWAGGMVDDRSTPTSVKSAGATGFAAACLPIAVVNGWLSQTDAAQRFTDTLGAAEAAEGERGFFYHFYKRDGRTRAWRSELSSMDTALLVAGLLWAGAHFGGELRRRAEALYHAVDWAWMAPGGPLLCHGWKPEHAGGKRRGFLRYHWHGYSEALLLYVLAAGSPTHPVGDDAYPAWLASYTTMHYGGQSYLYCGPLFTHHFPLCFLDLRGLHDAACRPRREAGDDGFDYLANARRATLAQRAYAVRNPKRFLGYGADSWGFTACDGPHSGRAVAHLPGGPRDVHFRAYHARGAPRGPDDGTLAPWSAATSLPLAPDAVLPAMRRAGAREWRGTDAHGWAATHNPSYRPTPGAAGWVSPDHLAVDMGPLAIMLENHGTGLMWRLCREIPAAADGLRRCGFGGGWLDE